MKADKADKTMGYEALVTSAKNALSALFGFDPHANAFVGRGCA
jgi:hypothetical protein